ncbi:zinc finger protein 616-like [Myzus persicae]|uniref:zinc finger protein 616-like n=1 Tax=Myzus persicae TaxID=13164 RepID=UPI000B937E2C|nr:zinc finger protein 616-like [Myzus persicae]XP_022181649.1 zinc finger protein 616-like [Myzus persicae]XP_022181650.1 zinc finger protein 616-like [Myzus persicae]
MLSSTHNNVDTGKWQEIVLNEIHSDHENCSDNELPLSSIVTTNKIDTKKWQDIILDNIQSNMENDSENNLSLLSIPMINDDLTNTKHQDINLGDIQSDIENYSDNELPLSSIANVLPPIDSCNVLKSQKNIKSDSISFQSKTNINHNISDSSHISIKEQSKIDTPMKKYGCDVCGKIFHRRVEIIEHFRTSLCFPESPSNLELNSPTYNCNSENPILCFKKISCLKINNTEDMIKCRICQNVIRNDDVILQRQIFYTNLCNICSVRNSIICANTRHLKEEYTWKCKTCGQSFTSLSGIKEHICFFPKNKLFNCYKCHKSYKNLNSLEKHKTFHSLHCNICFKEFFKQSSLRYHKKRHYLRSSYQYNNRLEFLDYSGLKLTKRILSSSQNYECSRCSKVFHKRSEIICHILENHQLEYSKYSCDECTNVCDSSQDYILCFRKKYFKCDVCPLSFTTEHRLQQHYGWHLGINKFKCEFCPKTFTNLSLYLSHEKTHTVERPFRCSFCGQWFPETSNLNIHIKPFKHFVCNICQKSYTQMSSLLFHKKIHAKKKCRVNKSCNQLSTMEIHSRRPSTRSKHFKCNVCAKSFFHSYSLRTHLKTHQKHKRPQKNSMRIKCDLCQKLFYDKNILLAHRCKSLTCTYCLKIFNNSSSLKRHYKNMHKKNNKLFDCDICKISFMCSTSLNEHRKNHTQFENNTPLKLNVNNDINTINEEFRCDLCMKSFDNQSQIFAHIVETHY